MKLVELVIKCDYLSKLKMYEMKIKKNPNEISRKISLKLFGRYNGIIDVMSVSIKLSLRTHIFLTIRRPMFNLFMNSEKNEIIRDFRPKLLREKSLTNLFFKK